MDSVGVGQYEHALSCVWGANGARAEHAPFRIEPERGQVTEDGSEVAVVNESWTVLQERESWSNHAKAFGSLGPHVAGVVGSGSLPGDAERLAGESGGDDIHSSSEPRAVAGSEKLSDVPEDRGRIK